MVKLEQVVSDCVRRVVYGLAISDCVRTVVYGLVISDCVRTVVYGLAISDCVRTVVYGLVISDCVRTVVYGFFISDCVRTVVYGLAISDFDRSEVYGCIFNYFISFILQSTLALGSEETGICVFYQVLRYMRPIIRTIHNNTNSKMLYVQVVHTTFYYYSFPVSKRITK